MTLAPITGSFWSKTLPLILKFWAYSVPDPIRNNAKMAMNLFFIELDYEKQYGKGINLD
jgi:hypothetical protein